MNTIIMIVAWLYIVLLYESISKIEEHQKTPAL